MSVSRNTIKKDWAINYVEPKPPAIFYIMLILMQIDEGLRGG